MIWFRNVKNFVANCCTKKNVAKFGLIYKWLFGLMRSLKFLIKTTYIMELSLPPPPSKMGDNFMGPCGTLNFHLPLRGGLAKWGV